MRRCTRETPVGIAATELLMDCWICGDSGTTGEHKAKRSDLRSVFGVPTQSDPLYYHTHEAKNRPVHGLNAKILKFPDQLCAKCNNARTQPHDRAWEELSGWLRSCNPPIASGQLIQPVQIFRRNTAREMRYFHLYFVKLFGCTIREGNIPIDTASFARAILDHSAHRNVYLRVCHSDSPAEQNSSLGRI